jgi:hypothetical protein
MHEIPQKSALFDKHQPHHGSYYQCNVVASVVNHNPSTSVHAITLLHSLDNSKRRSTAHVLIIYKTRQQ